MGGKEGALFFIYNYWAIVSASLKPKTRGVVFESEVTRGRFGGIDEIDVCGNQGGLEVKRLV